MRCWGELRGLRAQSVGGGGGESAHTGHVRNQQNYKQDFFGTCGNERQPGKETGFDLIIGKTSGQ